MATKNNLDVKNCQNLICNGEDFETLYQILIFQNFL